MRALLLRPGLSLLTAGVLLVLLCSLVSWPPLVRSDASPGTRANLDTRWIELIRSRPAGPQQTRSAVALPTLNLHLIDNLIAGRAFSAALITIDVWRDNAPFSRAVVTPYPDEVNYFYVLPLGQYPLNPGDVISLTQSGASFTMTVPALTAWADAPTDRVSGSAPVSRTVTTYLYSNATGSGPYTQTVEVDASGNYTVDYSATLDVRPRDTGYVAYSEAPGRTTYARFVTPFLRAQAGGSEISGLAAPLSWINLTAADAAGWPYAHWSAYSAPDGSFIASDYYGYRNIHLQPGDLITATSAHQTFTMTVLSLTAQIDLNNLVVEGNAPVNQPVELLRFNGPLCCASNAFWYESPAEQTTFTTTVTGYYSAALSLIRPNYGAALVTDADGNQTYARFVVPYLAARLGEYIYWQPTLLSGQINAAAVPVTIAIQGPSGYFKDVRSATTASDGYFYDYGSSGLALDSGDVITISTAQGVEVALQLPLLTGQIDPVTDIVSGTAPPGARLTVAINASAPGIIMPPTLAPAPTAQPYEPDGGGGLPSPSYTASVTATAQGTYLVNLHGTIDLNNASYGEVSLITVDGHAVSRILSLSRQESCDYRPYGINVGGNQVYFQAATNGCRQADYGTVRLRAANGNLKDQQGLPVWNFYNLKVSFYANGYPVAIAPGDRIEVEWSTTTSGPHPTPIVVTVPPVTPPPLPTLAPYRLRATTDNHLVTVTVPTLTVQIDPTANILSGHAPASSTVALSVYREYEFYFSSFTATVDARGSYTLSLPSWLMLTAGDAVEVSYKSIEPPAFTAIGVLPVIRTELYQPVVSGLLPPLTAYTATLQTSPAPSATLLYWGAAGNDGIFSFWLTTIKPGNLITVTTAQQTFHLTIPTLTAHVDRASATIFGQAPPFARLRIAPYSYYGSGQTVTATASGAYSVTFPELAPMNTTYGRVTYYDTDSNQVNLSFATVHWDVVIDDRCLTGIVDMAGTPLSLTLRSDAGTMKSTSLLTPAYPHYTACFTQAVQSGDRIFMQSAAATEVFTVPVLSARHNYARQAIEGAAPPNHAVSAELWWSNGVSRRAYSDVSGHYGVDTSDLRPPLQSRGRVILRDEAGNTTSAYFTVTGYPAFLPIVRR